jgi:hypothetical protein
LLDTIPTIGCIENIVRPYSDWDDSIRNWSTKSYRVVFLSVVVLAVAVVLPVIGATDYFGISHTLTIDAEARDPIGEFDHRVVIGLGPMQMLGAITPMLLLMRHLWL